MRRRLVIIGLVLLVVGVALFAAGSYGARSSLHTVSTLTERSPGEYVSPELNLTAEATISLVHAPASSSIGVITSENLSSVNATNLAAKSIAPTASSSNTITYLVGPGSFYVVYFGSAAPSSLTIDYLYLTSSIAYGVLVLAGMVLIAVGLILAVVGAILKPKPRSLDPTPFIQPPPP